jgi:phenylacetate-CoA ligase
MKPALSPQAILKLIRTGSEKEWGKLREKKMLALFKDAAKRVPAYKDFLKRNGIRPESVRTYADFQKVPPTSKADYLRKYPMKALLWDGDMEKPLVFSATSGSTGKPFYFPHGHDLDVEYSILADLFLGNAKPRKKPTLVIIAFGMGVWIGGVFTFQAFELASRRGQNLSIITPGINKEEILNALKNLSPNFGETVLIGYPPFIKDLLDDALLSGVNLPKLNLRILFAAESFNDTFRAYIAKSTGIKNIYRDTLNIYGTADIGAMAFETPTSILVRQLIMERELSEKAFGSALKVPTFAQYNPFHTNFEAPGGEILLTGSNAMPLIRYAVGDKGGVTTLGGLSEAGLSEKDIIRAAKKHDAPLYRLPFVYVFERADFSVKLYGATVFPEHVREALQNPLLLKYITGKFSMQTLTDKRHDQYLELNVELNARGEKSAELADKISKVVVENLLKKNSEYANNHKSMAERVIPHVVLWPHEDPLYFKPGIKQKWVKK